MNTLAGKTINDLYGLELTMFKFTIQGDSIKSEVAQHKVDIPKSNIAPATGCDIIIHGSSTNTSRIYGFNPNMLKNGILTTNFNGQFQIKVHGYCLPNQVDEVERSFKLMANIKISEFIEQMESQIAQLSTHLTA